MVRTRRRNTHCERNTNMPPKPALLGIRQSAPYLLLHIIMVLLSMLRAFDSTSTGFIPVITCILLSGMFWSSPIQDPSLVS